MAAIWAGIPILASSVTSQVCASDRLCDSDRVCAGGFCDKQNDGDDVPPAEGRFRIRPHPDQVGEAGIAPAQPSLEEFLSEHGVGLLKRGGLKRELSPSVLEMHRAIKRALDPAGILNRGKIFD